MCTIRRNGSGVSSPTGLVNPFLQHQCFVVKIVADRHGAGGDRASLKPSDDATCVSSNLTERHQTSVANESYEQELYEMRVAHEN